VNCSNWKREPHHAEDVKTSYSNVCTCEQKENYYFEIDAIVLEKFLSTLTIPIYQMLLPYGNHSASTYFCLIPPIEVSVNAFRKLTL